MWHYAKSGERHGPVSEDELIGLLRAGSVADHDLVWKNGMGEWQAAGEVLELQRVLFVERQPELEEAPIATRNGMAIASLVLGLASLLLGTLVLTALPGVICGHIARCQIREAIGAQSGDGMALAGLILSYIALVLTVLVVVFGVLIFMALSPAMGAP